MSDCLYLFDTTHHALWAEDVAREGRIPAEVVPAPADSDAKCALALRSTGAGCERLRAAMTSEGITFFVYAGERSDPD